MGEAAEMLLSGMVDHMGEYTGEYHDNLTGRMPMANKCAANERNMTVRNFMKVRGITNAVSQKRALGDYSQEVGTDRPTYHACNNWDVFKAFIDKRVNYVKPSKKKSPGKNDGEENS